MECGEIGVVKGRNVLEQCLSAMLNEPSLHSLQEGAVARAQIIWNAMTGF
jgi:hypothetical protein